VALPGPDSDSLLADARRLVSALSVEGGGGRDGGAKALDAVAAIAHPRLLPWANATAIEIVRAWIPASGAPASWSPLLARLDARAHAVGSLTAAAGVGDLAAERSRPVRLAIVGEFNAGKSTFINALIGADVAPTGVLPTTATLHHLRWGPDRFARILFAAGIEPRERIVPLSDLRSTLKGLDTASIQRVELRLPLASLVRVEILDTPGFNAPDPRHTRVARSAFEEADAAIWLLDATQAMKDSERAVLEEARAAGIPVQMLVNKADRLSTADLARVMETVRSAVETTRVGSWGAPLALSAKKALAARLDETESGGDSRALADSGWPEVETLIAREIVGRSTELKERALRRRATVVVADLIDAWGRRDDADRAEAAAQEARALEAAHAAARTERDAKDLADRLAASLVPSAQDWARDLELVFIGRDRKAAERDSTLARYRVDRAVSAIAPRLSRALATMAPEIPLSPEQLDPCARAAVRAAAWCSPSDPNDILAAIARATVATLIELLSSLSLPPPPPTGAAGVVRELQAFRGALVPRFHENEGSDRPAWKP
jgi:small GTP-binding protein